jgi:hypothetical protein
MSLVSQAIMNKDVSAEKLMALVDWYDKRGADNAFTRDRLSMSKELPEITKDGTIDQGITRSGRQGVKAKYATYENIHRATSGILHRHGFTLMAYNALRGEQTMTVLRLEHYDPEFGSSYIESMQPILRDDSAGKTLVQQWGSGEQYQLRRMVIKLLNLRSAAPVDDDRDGAPPAKPKPPEDDSRIDAGELKDLRAKIKQAKLPEKRVCEKYAIEELEHLPKSTLPDAHKALDNWIAVHGGVS